MSITWLHSLCVSFESMASPTSQFVPPSVNRKGRTSSSTLKQEGEEVSVEVT